MKKFFRLLTQLFELQVTKMREPPADASIDRLFNCIKSLESGSNRVSAWSLSVLGGSLLVILSNDYVHPENTNIKIAYLLFVIGWLFIGISFYNGKNIISRSIASELAKSDINLLKTIFTKCNSYYSRQLLFFNLALLVFGIWLLVFLFWWVFGTKLTDFLNLK